MLKKRLLLAGAVLLSGYFVFIIFYAHPESKSDAVCTKLNIEIKNSTENMYLGINEITQILHKAGIDPVGKVLSEIDAGNIETVLKKNSLIKRAECYKTINGTVNVKVYQRTPILRVMTNNGNYYIDSEAKKMPVPNNFSACLPVATGFIDDDFAQNELYRFTLFLQKNKFWNMQIEQIHVNPNKDIELTPRVGNHQILLGQIENCEENLSKLKLFYEKVLNRMGWNRYSKINLKYKNQIVCTRI
ncbi:MAG: hypothetical protein LBH32_00855 [Dysgonamonadaceae bacterium]|jgi:cell division protein FtsQ|nr:hypothetical protein [Dysgonamonadaceae bacterium]